MKKILFFLAFAFSTFSLFSQITNGGFEEWETFSDFDKPLHWDTNQDTFFTRFIKDTNSYEGDYALHAVPSGTNAWTGCPSAARLKLKFDNPIGSNQSLYFYVRALSMNANNDAYAEVSGGFFLGGTFISEYRWRTFEEYPEYSLIEIPIDAPSIDSLIINIWAAKVGSGNDDGCYSASQVWFDHFYIAEQNITSVKNIDEVDITIFPNPSIGEINLKGDFSLFTKYRIVNLLGQEMESGRLDNSFIKINTVGVLFLILENEEGESQIFKLNNQIN